MARSPKPQVRTSQFHSAPVSSATTPLIDIHGVAELLSIRPRYVQRLVSERRIPYFKVGRFIRFDPAEMLLWLDERRIEASAPQYRPGESGNMSSSRPGGPDALELIESSESVHLTQIPPRRETFGQ
jgi:excisionase family DNA binding protein